MRAWIKSLMPTSLFGRALLIIVSPLVLLQIIASLVFYEQHWEIVSRRLSWAVAGEIGFTVSLVEKMRGAAERQELLDEAGRRLGATFQWSEGEILTNLPPDPPDDPVVIGLVRALNEMVARPYVLDGNDIDRHVLIRVQLADGVVTAVFIRKRLHTSTTYVFILWMVGTSMILFAVAGVFMRNQVRPIRRLAIAAERFGKGQNPGDFRPEGASEVRRAGIEFNRMRERITRQLQQRTEMLAGVSHDLRTPLTRLRLELAMLGDGPDLEGMRGDLDEMERMLDAYLAFARGEAGEGAVPTDLTVLIEDVVDGARREGRQVDVTLDGPLTLDLRPTAIRRSLANLVSNACRHGGRVAVAAHRVLGAVELTVDDDGPGIPADRREEVFKPFFRLDAARSPNTGGVGLGLTIARDVMRGHGGDVVLEDSPLGGLRARVRLPI